MERSGVAPGGRLSAFEGLVDFIIVCAGGREARKTKPLVEIIDGVCDQRDDIVAKRKCNECDDVVE